MISDKRRIQLKKRSKEQQLKAKIRNKEVKEIRKNQLYNFRTEKYIKIIKGIN